MTTFKRAKEIKIFDDQGREWIGLKGIVNEADELDRFGVVGEGYKIAQHDDVYAITQKALEEMKLENNSSTVEMNEGRRLRINLFFPEIYHTIAGEKLNLQASLDNSYNSTTGLRLEIKAVMKGTIFHCSDKVNDELNSFYHRHTKGLEVSMLESTISKGIEIFQNKIGKEFEALVEIPVNAMSAKAFIEELENLKKFSVAKKYLNMFKEGIDTMGDKITNAWGLYSLMSSILTKEVESADLQRNNARKLIEKIFSKKWV